MKFARQLKGARDMRTVTEPQRETQANYEADVVVLGGGITGVPAAVAAARAGARTLLIERTGMLGGVATSGLMANIGNLFVADDGTTVIRGIAREIVVRLVEMGGTMPDWENTEVPGIVLESDKLQMVLLDMVEEAGVDVLLHAMAVGLVQEGGRATGVIIESPSGREAAMGKCLIDASGDADLAVWAGAPFQQRPASGSLEFLLANVDLDKTLDFIRKNKDGFPAGMDMTRDFETFERNWVQRGFWFFPHCGGSFFPPIQELVKQGKYVAKEGEWFDLDAFGMYGLRGRGTVLINSNFRRLTQMDVREFTSVEMGSRRVAFKAADFLRRYIPGFENSHVVRLASEWGQRLTRWIVGAETLRFQEMKAGREWDDVIGLYTQRRELVDEASRLKELTQELPYGIMIPQKAEGFLVASGKSVSTDPPGLLRGMQRCMVLGQAAGVGAALASKEGVSPSKVRIADVQRELLKQGAYLGTEERLRELGLA
jgi:hypothetical protein